MDDYDIKDIATNATNSTADTQCPYNYCVEDTIYRMVIGTLLFVIVWPFIVQDIKFFPLGRPVAALMGATLMVVFNVTPQGQVYHILGERGNLQAICLLVGMMMLSYYYDREGLLNMAALWIFNEQGKFRHVLWKVCILSAFMSAILTNDATCVVLTPLLLNEHTRQKRPLQEIAPLLLGIATSANIGSASTFFGNPQNAFIASQTDLSLLIFFVATLPAAVIGISINTSLLYLVYYKVIFMQESSCCSTGPTSDSAIVATGQSHTFAVSNGLMTPPTTSMSMEGYQQQHELPSDSLHSTEQVRLCCPNPTGTNPQHGPFTNTERVGDSTESETSLSSLSTADIRYGATNTRERGRDSIARRNDRSTKNINICKRPLREKLFVVWLGLVTLLLVVVLAIPPLQYVTFNLGLVPIGAAVFTMSVDTVIHRRPSKSALTNVDWTIILMFFGLFVWLVGFENTSLPRRVFKKMNRFMKLSSVTGVLLFTLFVIIGSNILSNVPLIILIIDELETFDCGLKDCSQITGVLLAWVSTIAGNFTLIGSVANLIVAEKARSCANYNLTFWEHLKFGIPSTILVLFSGLPIAYFTSKHVTYS